MTREEMINKLVEIGFERDCFVTEEEWKNMKPSDLNILETEGIYNIFKDFLEEELCMYIGAEALPRFLRDCQGTWSSLHNRCGLAHEIFIEEDILLTGFVERNRSVYAEISSHDNIDYEDEFSVLYRIW